jgi:hypothetical protein
MNAFWLKARGGVWQVTAIDLIKVPGTRASVINNGLVVSVGTCFKMLHPAAGIQQAQTYR